MRRAISSRAGGCALSRSRPPREAIERRSCTTQRWGSPFWSASARRRAPDKSGASSLARTILTSSREIDGPELACVPRRVSLTGSLLKLPRFHGQFPNAAIPPVRDFDSNSIELRAHLGVPETGLAGARTLHSLEKDLPVFRRKPSGERHRRYGVGRRETVGVRGELRRGASFLAQPASTLTSGKYPASRSKGIRRADGVAGGGRVGAWWVGWLAVLNPARDGVGFGASGACSGALTGYRVRASRGAFRRRGWSRGTAVRMVRIPGGVGGRAGRGLRANSIGSRPQARCTLRHGDSDAQGELSLWSRDLHGGCPVLAVCTLSLPEMLQSHRYGTRDQPLRVAGALPLDERAGLPGALRPAHC